MERRGVQWGLSLGGGGARLPWELGVLTAMHESGIFDTWGTYAAIGTSTGAIATALLHILDISDTDSWKNGISPILSLQGFKEPWRKLSRKPEGVFALRQLALDVFYEEHIKQHASPQGRFAPAASFMTVTKPFSLRPMILSDTEWTDAGGTCDTALLLRCAMQSASIPLVFGTHAHPTYGTFSDGGMNFSGLSNPFKVLAKILQPHALIISLEPLSEVYPPGIHTSHEDGRVIHHVVYAHKALPFAHERIRGMYSFDPNRYYEGLTMGKDLSRFL